MTGKIILLFFAFVNSVFSFYSLSNCMGESFLCSFFREVVADTLELIDLGRREKGKRDKKIEKRNGILCQSVQIESNK